MVANGDRDLANEHRSNYVHKLGNLTLTGHNSQLSNMSFEKKRDREKDGKKIGYKNGLWLNKSLSEKNQWTINDIESRTEYLIEKALKLFSLE